MREARRCTAPMNAPCPPPTMPRRMRPMNLSLRPVTILLSPRNFARSADPMRFLVRLHIHGAAGKIVEGVRGDLDDMRGDEGRALGRACHGILQRAFPFENCPAVIVVLRELGEDGGKIDLAIAERTEPAGTFHPALEAGIDALLAGRVELAVLHMKGEN